MAQRIVTLCDVHQQHDAETPGRPWSVAIGVPGSKVVTYEIDLCDDDGKPLDDLLQLLREVGRQVDGPRPSRAVAAGSRIPCPHCDKASKSAKTLRDHIRRAHPDVVTPLTAGAGYPCPECPRSFETPQGRGAHRKSAHGVAGASAQ